MEETKGKGAIVEGNEGIGGRKRINEDKDAHPAKRTEVDGNKNAERGGGGGGGEEEGGGGEELEQKIDRLRGMLEGDLATLRNKDVEDVIRYLDVDEIISLALNSRQANENVFDEDGYLEAPFCAKPWEGTSPVEINAAIRLREAQGG